MAQSGLLTLNDEAMRVRLLELTPEATSQEAFSQLIAELRQSAAEQYRGFKQLSNECLDCCGTGGSGIPRFNTSTAVAFLLAAAGVPVVKFGNRAASSRSGSFDFLSEIGFTGSLSADNSLRMFAEEKLIFLYAPDVYPALGKLSSMRKSLGQPTVLNYAGPLLNPCLPALRFMGISHSRMQELAAQLLVKEATNRHATIIRSKCGLDEVCPACGADALTANADTNSIERMPLLMSSTSQCAASSGFSDSDSYTPKGNAKRFFNILDGIDNQSVDFDLLVMNSAGALKTAGIADSMDGALTIAKELVSNGELKRKYLRLRECYEKYAG